MGFSIMTCIFCGARNNESETRCRKCGRKPGDTLNGDFTLARTEGALATKLQPIHFEANAPRAPRQAIRGVQQQLFPGQSNVVPIAMYAPPRVESKPQARKSTPRRRPVAEGQGALDFLPPEAPKPRTLSTTVEAVVSCDSPVAPTVHRAIAGAIDCGLALIGYAMFLTLYFLLGGEFSWDRLNLEVFAGALLLIGFTYGLVWTVVGADTAGMRLTGLRLTTFEGFPLERKHRVMRFVGGCLSLCTMVGHLWSLADEESLTWHDHISRTFPTPRKVYAEVFRRV
jgi:uncharacterized RDD family membrane protein YckC